MYKTIILATVTAFALSTGVAAQYYSTRFADVPPGHWAEQSINFISQKGIMNGKSSFAFAPNDFVNRAELAVILERLYKTGSLNDNYNNLGNTRYDYQNPYYNSYNYYNNNPYYNSYNNNNQNTTYDSSRRSDIDRIVAALERYSRDNSGRFPNSIEEDFFIEICYSSSGESCRNLVDLSVLQGQYLSEIPRDPSLRLENQRSANTGYFVKLDQDGRVHVLAKLASNVIERIAEPAN